MKKGFRNLPAEQRELAEDFQFLFQDFGLCEGELDLLKEVVEALRTNRSPNFLLALARLAVQAKEAGLDTSAAQAMLEQFRFGQK